jgi:hypothetical protein
MQMNRDQLQVFVRTFAVNEDAAMGMPGRPDLLGSGYFASVFDIGYGRVLKVIKDEDPGYEWFVTQIEGITDNPFLPRVFYSETWGDRRVYCLEKLTPLKACNNRCEMYDTWRNVRDAMMSENSFMTILHPKLRQIRSILSSSKYRIDLHDENMMVRGDQIVITDPVSFTKTGSY